MEFRICKEDEAKCQQNLYDLIIAPIFDFNLLLINFQADHLAQTQFNRMFHVHLCNLIGAKKK